MRSHAHHGFTLIEVLVVVAIIGTLVGLTFAAVQKVRARAAQLGCSDRLRQLGLAVHNHEAARGALPPGVTPPDRPSPYLHWHARLLPDLEQGPLWAEIEQAFKADPDFLHIPPHSARLQQLPAFLCPADSRGRPGESAGLTSYLGVSGTTSPAKDGCLFLGSKVAIRDIRDGASSTLLVGERPPSADLVFGWWYAGWGQRPNASAGDAILGVSERNLPDRFSEVPGCGPGPYRFGPSRASDPCGVFHYWSLHPGGANFLFADGAVRLIQYEAADLLPALATRAGGETVTLPD